MYIIIHNSIKTLRSQKKQQRNIKSITQERLGEEWSVCSIPTEAKY